MTEQSLFSKAFTPEAELSKDQIANILFVVKQVLGLILGIVIGIVGLHGFMGIGAYALLSSAICYVYLFRYIQVDEDVIHAGQVLKEHFAPGFFMFLLTWILTYNLVNF